MTGDQMPLTRIDAEVVTPGETALVPTPTPMQILAKMTEAGASAESIQVLADLAWKQQDRDAVTAFNEALAQFHALCPELINETKGVIKDKQGVKIVISWMYTKLPLLVAKIRPVLNPLGLTLSFDEVLENGIVTGACTLNHVLGHSMTAHASCPTSSRAGMSAAHAHTAAGNNTKRRALIDVLGITPVDEPDENSTEDVGPITDAQAADLAAMISEVGASLGRFLAYYKIESVGQLPANEFSGAIQMLRERASR